jgi:hypothetical protein
MTFIGFVAENASGRHILDRLLNGSGQHYRASQHARPRFPPLPASRSVASSGCSVRRRDTSGL